MYYCIILSLLQVNVFFTLKFKHPTFDGLLVATNSALAATLFHFFYIFLRLFFHLLFLPLILFQLPLTFRLQPLPDYDFSSSSSSSSYHSYYYPTLYLWVLLCIDAIECKHLRRCYANSGLLGVGWGGGCGWPRVEQGHCLLPGINTEHLRRLGHFSWRGHS